MKSIVIIWLHNSIRVVQPLLSVPSNSHDPGSFPVNLGLVLRYPPMVLFFFLLVAIQQLLWHLFIVNKTNKTRTKNKIINICHCRLLLETNVVVFGFGILRITYTELVLESHESLMMAALEWVKKLHSARTWEHLVWPSVPHSRFSDSLNFPITR